MTTPYAAEREFALDAVRLACTLTDNVFRTFVKEDESLTKDDKSPVTVGDFAAQALISTLLSKAFPDDAIVGEEDSSTLRAPASAHLLERITDHTNTTLASLSTATYLSSITSLAPNEPLTTDEVCAQIDRGNNEGGRKGRMWTIDPIDGTKGFLRGEQYAVCLAFLVDGVPLIGSIGCPNLLHPSNTAEKGVVGGVFVAERGQGAFEYPLVAAPGEEKEKGERLSMPDVGEAGLVFLESVEAAHSSHSTAARIAAHLSVVLPPVRMDSQAKYCALARGDASVYMRMPTGVGYREKIWDHAAGGLLVKESGGKVTDSRGEELDFGLGRTLGENWGVIAAKEGVHARVLDGVKKALEEEKTEKVVNL